MELDVFKILLRHAQHVARIGKKDIAPLNILGHVLVLALLEVLEFLLVICLYPASLVKMHGLPAALGVVLVLQAVLDNLELQLTNRAHDAAAVELVDEELRHTLVHELLQSLLELLVLHRVIILDVLEKEWREAWQTAKMHLLSLRQRISYLENTVVWQTYNVTRISLVNGTLALCHELGRRRETHVLIQAHVVIWLISHKFARAYLTESDAGAVVWINIGCNFEDETTELRFFRLHQSLICLGGSRRWSNMNKTVEEFLNTKIVQCRTEEHRCYFGRTVGFFLKLRLNTIYQFQFLTQLCSLTFTNPLVEF